MMNSSLDDEFGDNPFRSNNGLGGQPDMFAPQQQQQPVLQQQQQQQFQQLPIPQQSFQQQQQQPAMQQQQQAPQWTQQPVPQQQQAPQWTQQVPPPQQQQQFAPQQQQQQFATLPQQQFQQQPPVHPNMPAGLMTPQQQQQAPGPPAVQPAPVPRGPLGWYASCMSCLTLDSYKVYFDIDADDIVTRIRGVLLHFYKPEHFRNNVMGMMKTEETKGPDLYGPFWITMTLIFFVGVTANLHGYAHRNEVDNFDYDINHLLHAASILISFAFVLPVVLWMTTSCCMNMNALQLVEWLALYGYSLVPYMPAVMLSVIPVSIVAWITLSAATAVSCLLVIRNVAPVIMSFNGGQGSTGAAKGPPVILVMLGCHVMFLLVMKFTFYHFTPSHSAATTTTTLMPSLSPVEAPIAAPAAAPTV